LGKKVAGLPEMFPLLSKVYFLIPPDFNYKRQSLTD